MAQLNEPMKDSETVTKRLSGQALQRLIKHVQNTRGETTAIVNELTKLTGQTQYRQNVEEWLHPDPEKRVEPRLGVGLALLIVGASRAGRVTVAFDGIHTEAGRQPVPKAKQAGRSNRSKKTAKKS